MKTTNTLVFTGHFTARDAFVVTAGITAPSGTALESMIDKQFKWLASSGPKAVEKQREATLRAELRNVASVNNVCYVLVLDEAGAFLNALKYVNSSNYDESLLKKIRYYCETANLQALRRVVSSIGGTVHIQRPLVTKDPEEVGVEGISTVGGAPTSPYAEVEEVN